MSRAALVTFKRSAIRFTSRKARMSAWSVLLRIWVRCRFLCHNDEAHELWHWRTTWMQQSCQTHAAHDLPLPG